VPKEISELRTYLLGLCEEESEKEKIEERLILDADYFQQLLLEEEKLIEDYVDDELEADKRAVFENHFLIPEERRERVKLLRLLKNNLARADDVSEISEAEPPKKKWSGFKSFFLSPLPAAAIVVLAILAISFFWWNYSDSNVRQKALVSLNKAYVSERPVESRISGFDYAPFDKTRAPDDETKINRLDRNRAERMMLDEVSENPTPENQHLLALIYFAKKEFDQALQLLEEARKKSPQDATILSDLGVVYLEKSRVASKDEEKLAGVADALQNFERALAINPNLPSARFNKAVATEIYLPNRAKEAWKEYLDLDQTSEWATEAREHLERLNKSETQNISTAEDLETAFLEAYRAKNDERAFQIVSQNRELINGKYLPQRLAGAFVEKKKTNSRSSS
jgi:tetratricopeptide (TPR) repeat protein